MQSANYSGIDFRDYPERYRIGRGEQGVLQAEPYKSEILPHWRFKTVIEAETSAKQIFAMFKSYGRDGDFVGMDMARKYLQMGFTRARRYANHPSGRKYDSTTGSPLPQAEDWKSNEKAQAAKVFYEYYQRAKSDSRYGELRTAHTATQKAEDAILKS
jgi:hypothetical protein